MDNKAITMMIICLIVLLTSFIYAFFNPSANFFGDYPLTIIVIIFFFFGVLSFGLFSFIPHAILGLSLGTKKSVTLLLYLLPIALATYAGLKLGSILLDDFRKKKYFLEEIKPVFQLIFFAIIISLAIEVLIPIIIEQQFWPEDTFGMSIERPQNVLESLEALKNSLM